MHQCSVDGTPCYSLSSCYHHLKDHLRHGEHLSDDEMTFIGFTSSTRAPDGWYDVMIGLPSYELESWEVDAEDAQTIAALMAIGAGDRLEFLR